MEEPLLRTALSPAAFDRASRQLADALLVVNAFGVGCAVCFLERARESHSSRAPLAALWACNGATMNWTRAVN